MDWKINVDIVLTIEGYKYVLTEERPDLPAVNALKADLEIYE